MLEFVDSDLYFVQDKNNFINPLLQVGSGPGSVEKSTGSGSSSLGLFIDLKKGNAWSEHVRQKYWNGWGWKGMFTDFSWGNWNGHSGVYASVYSSGLLYAISFFRSLWPLHGQFYGHQFYELDLHEKLVYSTLNSNVYLPLLFWCTGILVGISLLPKN